VEGGLAGARQRRGRGKKRDTTGAAGWQGRSPEGPVGSLVHLVAAAVVNRDAPISEEWSEPASVRSPRGRNNLASR
jgi:hypothetical protein